MDLLSIVPGMECRGDGCDRADKRRQRAQSVERELEGFEGHCGQIVTGTGGAP